MHSYIRSPPKLRRTRSAADFINKNLKCPYILLEFVDRKRYANPAPVPFWHKCLGCRV